MGEGTELQELATELDDLRNRVKTLEARVEMLLVVPAPIADRRWPVKQFDRSQPGHDREDVLRAKAAQYLDPAAEGASLSQEGQMFRQAIADGHISPDAAGLETLLAYLSVGFADRPVAITDWLAAFFESDRRTAVVYTG